MKKTQTLWALALLPMGGHAADANPLQPNIVLIMCDDMGFSDLGCYGSEIHTPNIDKLARYGVRFSQFKNTGRSCPSRASLLTGRYQHEVGMGWMAEVDEHRPGYRGQISRDYLYGGGGYYKPSPVFSNLRRITDFPDDYYYTNAITDSAVSFIKGHDPSRPMFLYLAHYAPHLPLQAPERYVQRCLDRYREGYDVLRQRRFEKQKKLGLVPADMSLPMFDSEFGGHRPAWTELTPEQQKQWTHDMAIYAAMIEIMDEGIGKVVETIRRKGMLENTVFLFLSDNGATLEGGFLGQLMADLSNTPYRSYKQWCFQGGTSSPLIVTYGDPDKNRMAGKICTQPCHIIDILPTCLALANVNYPDTCRPAALPGRSLLPTAFGRPEEPRTLYFEHQASCAIIDGYWKLVRRDRNSPWQLINLSTDPFETHDLASEKPRKVEELEAKWIAWAETHHVFPLEDKSWTQRINFYKQKNPDQSGRQ